MIGSMLSLLLVPFYPSLEDPQKIHEADMGKLKQILQKTSQPVVIDPALLVFAPPPPSPLPPISGRLLSQKIATAQTDANTDGKAVVRWSLTGLILSGGQRVAILSDGINDHVVAQGSYVNRQFKVGPITANSTVLIPVTSEHTKPIRLILTDTAGTGASNE